MKDSVSQALLSRLGLNGYESQVYLALVELGTVRVRELVGSVAIPRNQVYHTLKRMADRGICIEHPGRFKRYSALPPLKAFGAVLEEQGRQFAEAQVELAELHKRYKSGRNADNHFELVDILRGRSVTARTDVMYRQAKREVLECCRVNLSPSKPDMDHAIGRELTALKRGVRIRSIYQEDVLGDERLLSYLRRTQEVGERSRVLKSVPMDMIIADGAMAMFSLSTPGREIVVFVFNHPALVAVMKEGFENMWARAREHSLLTGHRKGS